MEHFCLRRLCAPLHPLLHPTSFVIAEQKEMAKKHKEQISQIKFDRIRFHSMNVYNYKISSDICVQC